MFHLTYNMREQSFWAVNCTDTKLTINNRKTRQNNNYAKQNLQTNVKTQ